MAMLLMLFFLCIYVRACFLPFASRLETSVESWYCCCKCFSSSIFLVFHSFRFALYPFSFFACGNGCWLVSHWNCRTIWHIARLVLTLCNNKFIFTIHKHSVAKHNFCVQRYSQIHLQNFLLI